MSGFDVPVREYMTAPLVSVRAGSFIDHAHRKLQEYRISALGVVDDDGRVVGVVSRTDVLRVGRREAGSTRDRRLLAFPAKPVSSFMTPDPVTVAADGTIREAADLMRSRRIHRVFVRDGADTVGVLTTRDVMRAIGHSGLEAPLSSCMSTPLYTVRASEPVALATERLENARVTGLVVVDAQGWPVGIFAQVEALEARDVARDTAVEDVMSPGILVLEGETPLHRAAAQAGALDVRRVVVVEDEEPVGIVTGLDFAGVIG